MTINPRVVSIPTPVDLLGRSGAPTGAVFNITTLPDPTKGGFMISGFDAENNPTSAPARFIFATEDGTIVGWNPGVNPKGFNPANAGNYGIIAVDNSGNNFTVPPSSATGAVYKGLAIATDANGVTRLYVTNFRSGMVEAYDVNFHALTSPPAFVDPKLPDSYAPFNIVPINGELFVTFAVQNAEKHDDVAGQSHGIVDVFDLDGTFRQRFAQHDQLNSPWGVALAPPGFGEGGALWIGNFGNGHINAWACNGFTTACVSYSSLINPALRSASLRPSGKLCRQCTCGAGLFRSCEPRTTFARFEPRRLANSIPHRLSENLVIRDTLPCVVPPLWG